MSAEELSNGHSSVEEQQPQAQRSVKLDLLSTDAKSAVFTLAYQAGRFLSTHDDKPLINFHWLTFPLTSLSFNHLLIGLVLIGERGLGSSALEAVLFASLIMVWFPLFFVVYGFVTTETKAIGVYYSLYIFGGYALTAALLGLETAYLPSPLRLWLRPLIGLVSVIFSAVLLQVVIGHIALHGHAPVQPEAPEWYPGAVDILQRTFNGGLMMITWEMYRRNKLSPKEMDIMYTTKEHFMPDFLRKENEAVSNAPSDDSDNATGATGEHMVAINGEITA